MITSTHTDLHPAASRNRELLVALATGTVQDDGDLAAQDHGTVGAWNAATREQWLVGAEAHQVLLVRDARGIGHGIPDHAAHLTDTAEAVVLTRALDDLLQVGGMADGGGTVQAVAQSLRRLLLVELRLDTVRTTTTTLAHRIRWAEERLTAGALHRHVLVAEGGGIGLPIAELCHRVPEIRDAVHLAQLDTQ